MPLVSRFQPKESLNKPQWKDQQSPRSQTKVGVQVPAGY